MKRTRKFPARKESVREARRFIRETLSAHPSEARDAIELMASELATNCIAHATSDFEIQVETTKGTVRIETHDHGPGEPVAQSAAPTDPTGRGLRIVEAMSDRWGVIPGTPGKTVWFELESTAPSADESLIITRMTRHGSSPKSSPEKTQRRTGGVLESRSRGRTRHAILADADG
jgi:anti-sigma regulatory factor (Ser/Thr protein kinase)